VYPGREIYMAITNAAHIGSKGQSCSPAGPNPAGAGECDLAALADRLTVLFPWGSLLDAVALPEPASLARLRALCKPGAEVRIVFERASRMEALESAYGEAGLAMRERQMSIEEVRALPTIWAKKLGYSGRPRQFCAFEGRVVP